MILFLHDKGYSCFNIPLLTYPEINQLVDACKRKAKKEEAMQKKSQQRAKMKGRFR